ncbi:hypothetical protein [Streptomyces sp. NPDC002853]
MHIDWCTYDRLDRASLDMAETNCPEEDVIRGYETVREAMQLALISVLNAFDHRAQAPVFRFGFVVSSQRTTP